MPQRHQNIHIQHALSPNGFYILKIPFITNSFSQIQWNPLRGVSTNQQHPFLLTYNDVALKCFIPRRSSNSELPRRGCLKKLYSPYIGPACWIFTWEISRKSWQVHRPLPRVVTRESREEKGRRGGLNLINTLYQLSEPSFLASAASSSSFPTIPDQSSSRIISRTFTPETKKSIALGKSFGSRQCRTIRPRPFAVP